MTHPRPLALVRMMRCARRGPSSRDDTMTVFIRHDSDDEYAKVRAEVFKSGFPASALITAKDFARPEILVEIQAVAVIGERN